MYNVLFYHANTIYFNEPENSLFLSIVSVYFKTYIEINKPDIANQIKWHRPFQKQLDDDKIVEYINSNKIDLLCLSIYLWNQQFVRDQLLRIKNKLHPNCKIMIGGPSVDVNIDDTFFIQHPYADYAIYGPGETAFADLLEHLLEDKKLIAFNVSNLAWFDQSKDKLVVAGYKNVSQSQVSPFLYNKDFFEDIVSHEIKDNNYKVILPYELTRGCPYSCTFCDWNSGLSNKVSRRKHTYQEEIDLFQKIGINSIYFADANFGQYDEDIEIAEYLVQKNLLENANFKIDGNLSKLKKDNNLKLYHLFAKGDLVGRDWAFTFSVQDINKTVLNNIERPDVGWDVHKKMILELHNCYPHYNSKIQFIVGLPGQNLATIKESLIEIISCPNVVLCPFINELLPASPASLNLEYQSKFLFKYSRSERIDMGGNAFRGTFPQSCFSFSKEEFVQMMVLATFITGLAFFKEKIRYRSLDTRNNLEKIIDTFMESIQFEKLCENLYNNWVTHDKFYYTIDFDLNKSLTSACNMAVPASSWNGSLNFKKMIMTINYADKDLTKSVLLKKINQDYKFEAWFPDR